IRPDRATIALLPSREVIVKIMSTLHRISLLCFILLLVFATAPAQDAPAAPVIYLRCGTALVGKDEIPQKNVILAISKDRIQQVGATASSGQVIDLSNETCLPGLIDTHTHVLLQGDITAADYDVQLLKQSPEYRTILATRNVRRMLGYGFTSIRDLET